MKKSLSFLIISLIAFAANADVSTDKLMTKISRDTETYISADVRATTKEEAYNEAINKLSVLIADYFRSERPGDTPPDVTSLSNNSAINQMSSKIADNRYRVMLYVRKSDLKSAGGSANSLVLSKPDNDSYSPMPKDTPEPQVKTEDGITIRNKPMDPVLSTLSNVTTRDEIVEKLQSLSKSKDISGAAKFPLSHANNFYLVVLDNNRVVSILHYCDNGYQDIKTSEPVDISKYSHCTGYWFTL